MKLNKQNKIIVGALAFLLTLTVGYAVFSQSLNITGTAKAEGNFSLIFEKDTENNPKCDGYSSECNIDNLSSISTDKKTLNITVDKLTYPTAYVSLPVKIKNEGSIDALLEKIEVNGLSNDDIEVTYSITDEEIKKGYIIKANESKNMTVKVLWKEDSTNTNPETLNFTITLKYVQYTNSLVDNDQSTSLFPVIEGQLGENVFYTYNNGNISITGSGSMNAETTSLAKDISAKAITQLSLNDDAVTEVLNEVLDLFISGDTYEDNGVTREELKTMLLTSQEEGGMGLTEEQAESVLVVLDSVPTPKSIVIGENITSIRANLLDFKNITTIEIPSTIETIGDRSIRGDDLATIINKTGKSFDWKRVITGNTGSSFISGEVVTNSQIIDITSEQIACSSMNKKETYNVGDTISICNDSTGKSEEFYVTKDNGSTVTALAKYNLLVGKYLTFGSGTLSSISTSLKNYGLQSEKTLFDMDAYSSGKMTNFYGVTDFAEKNESHKSGVNYLGYWTDSNGALLSKYGSSYPSFVYDENSIIYEYIENYENYIKNTLEKNSVNVTLPSYEDLTTLGCTSSTCENAPSWVYNKIIFWTGSADSELSLWNVLLDGTINGNLFSPASGETRGVRPLITISKSDL